MRLTGKYRYLTFEDRKKIEAWHLLGDRPVDIAARLSVHHTTIYKELQRGATGALDANQREGYSAELAERRLRESFKRRGIVNAAIALIGAGVSVFLIPWLKKQTTEAQRKELTAWVKIGVAAAEQLYVGQGRGEEKKQYVLDFLKQKGFKVDEESVVNAIEAVVKQLNTEGLTIE